MIEWKVPGKPSASAEIELYDYQEDPNETLNQAGQQPGVVKAMRERLNEHPEAKKQYRATAVSRTPASDLIANAAHGRARVSRRRLTSYPKTEPSYSNV
ncbi:MAG: hypothetical protein R3C05_26600 [Pirellulaceae bacterium]